MILEMENFMENFIFRVVADHDIIWIQTQFFLNMSLREYFRYYYLIKFD